MSLSTKENKSQKAALTMSLFIIIRPAYWLNKLWCP